MPDRVANRLGRRVHIVGVHRAHIVHTEPSDDALDVDLHKLVGSGLFTTGTRVGLISGHGGGTVVEDHKGEVDFVVHRVHEPWQPRVEEGGVSYKGDHRLLRDRCKSAGHPHACPHAHIEIGRADRRQVPQSVAPDVGREYRVPASGDLDCIVCGRVGAPGTENGRAKGHLRRLHGRQLTNG